MDDEEYTMVMPWMANGTIVGFLRENMQANPLKLARAFVPFYEPHRARLQLEDASRGLQYLHSMDLAHGHLKGV